MARRADIEPIKYRRRVGIGDVSLSEAAALMNLSPEEFREKLSDLLNRGFPAADPTTKMFDLHAIHRWRALRHRRLFPELAGARTAEDAATVFDGNLKDFMNGRPARGNPLPRRT